MKWLVVIFVMVSAALIAQSGEKLWVSIQYEYKGDRVLIIQDRETGTRCYAMTNNNTNMSGYAIACVK